MGGISGEQLRLAFQGFFLAPHIVSQALKGCCLFAAAFYQAGYTVSPLPDEPRSDIIQTISVGNAAQLIALAEVIQRSAPVDAHLHPEAWQMPGYNDAVIMAAGAFVQGSSIELSMDAPLREPYTAYLQGGLTYEHIKIALLEVMEILGL